MQMEGFFYQPYHVSKEDGWPLSMIVTIYGFKLFCYLQRPYHEKHQLHSIIWRVDG